MKSKKKNTPVFKTAEVVTLVMLTCLVSLLMGIIISEPEKNSNSISVEIDSDIQSFIEQYNYIVENYYGEVDKKALLDAALQGMVESLDDPYSSYLDENESSTFNATLDGSYEGIGIEITNDAENNIIVTQVFENTAAKEAGIKPLDKIISLNNEKLIGVSTSDFASKVRELPQATFNLGIKRGEEIIAVTVTRKNVTLTSVTSKILEKANKKIGYINVSIFALNTASQFKTSLDELESKQIDSLIIDLRGNTGGHLTAVDNMISQFLDSSHVIYQMKKKEETTKYYSKGTKTKTYPIIIIVDSSSASASEMMTAALKESYGAVVVGKTTFGKGTVQELQNSNDSQYKITTKKWLTPNGNWINNIGIKPDYEIELSQKYYVEPTDENDNQLQKALELLTK